MYKGFKFAVLSDFFLRRKSGHKFTPCLHRGHSPACGMRYDIICLFNMFSPLKPKGPCKTDATLLGTTTSPNISIVLWPAKRSTTMLHPFAWNHNNVGLLEMSAHTHCNHFFRITVPECIASLDDRPQCWQLLRSFAYTTQ